MAFSVRTANRAPLTRSREQNITTVAMSDGVITGMQLHDGSSGFQLDLTGGTVVLNGIVISDDQDYGPLLTLPSPTNDEHHIIYLYYDPDVGGDPTYHIESDRYDAANTGAVVTTPAHIGNSIILGEVFVPNTASTIADCTIVNRERIEEDANIMNYLGLHKTLRMNKSTVLESTGTYTLHFDDAQMVVWSPNKYWGDAPKLKPGWARRLQTSTNSTLGDYTSGVDYEISITPDANDEVIIFYARDTGDFGTNSGPLDVYAVSYGETTPGTLPALTEIEEVFGDAGSGSPTEPFPDRQDHKNVFIMAIVDLESATGAVHYANGVSMRVGDEFEDGRVNSYISEITSTGYGTTGSVMDGSIDIDTVLDNAAILHDAGLDDAYDSFETGGSAGAGRAITVDAGAVELSNVPDDTTPGDPWNAAMRFALDSAGSDEAESHERAIDVYSDDQDSERIALVNRRPYYSSNRGGLVTGSIFDLTNVGGQVQVEFAGGGPGANVWLDEHDDNDVYANSRWISLPGATGDASDKTYRLRHDEAGSYFYLETIDGVDTIPATYPNDFTSLPQSLVSGTLWEIHNQIGQTSVVQDLQVQGTLSGPGDQPLAAQIHLFGYPDVQTLVEDIDDGGDMQLGIFGLGASFLNVPYRYVGQGFGASRLTLSLGEKATNIKNTMCTDGRYIYVVADFTTGSPVPVKVFNSRDFSLVKTISTTNNGRDDFKIALAANGDKLAIGFQDSGTGNPRVEFWNTGTGGMDWGVAIGSGEVEDMVLQDSRLAVALSNTTTDEVFVLLATSNGTQVADSTAGSLDLNRKADGLHVCMHAYGDKLVLASNASNNTGTYLTFFDPGWNVAFDATGELSALDIYDTRDICVNDNYLFLISEDSTQDWYLYKLRCNRDFSNVEKVEELLLSTGSIITPLVECAHDRVVVSFVDTTQTQSELWVLDADNITNGPLYRNSIDTATTNLNGMCTDGQDFFYVDSVGNGALALSLGRKPTMWARVNNRVATTQFKPFQPYLAVPASGF